MSADFTNYDPSGVHDVGQAKARFACKPAPDKYQYEPMHVSTCNCDDCLGKRVREAMRAATCDCGHVGAECFNDEYCKPVDSVVMGWEWNQAAAHWHAAYTKRSDEAVATEIKLQNRVTELEKQRDSALKTARQLEEWYTSALKEISTMREEINDLQADCAAWANNYHALNNANEYTALEQEERIADLETTIRVLSGMVNE